MSRIAPNPDDVNYRYGFNGKEMDHEIKGSANSLDYGFRIYDPRVGRFLSVDPLTGSYPWYSPYQYAGNKPINNIDLDGTEENSNILDINIEYTGGCKEMIQTARELRKKNPVYLASMGHVPICTCDYLIYAKELIMNQLLYFWVNNNVDIEVLI